MFQTSVGMEECTYVCKATLAMEGCGKIIFFVGQRSLFLNK